MDKKKPKSKIDVCRIGAFLKSVEGAEYIYLQHNMAMREQFQYLINRDKLTKHGFCKLFNIKQSEYKNYTMGNYNYSVHDMARLNIALGEKKNHMI